MSFKLAVRGGPAVKHLPLNLKVEGSDAAIAAVTGREEIAGKSTGFERKLIMLLHINKANLIN